jgi:tetratricopeptide (TPR) repeat protein
VRHYKKPWATFFYTPKEYRDYINADLDTLKVQIEKNPDDFALHFLLGECYYGLGEYEKALEAYNQTLKLNEDHLKAKRKVAEAYFVMDSMEIAKEKYEELIDICPDVRDFYEKLGAIYWQLGEFEDILHIYKQYDKDTYLNLSRECGIACAFRGRYEEAIEYYHKAMEERHSLAVELAMIYWNTGDTLSANDWKQKALEILSKYYRGAANDVLLSYKAFWYYRLGEYEKAIAFVDTLIQLKKDNYVDIYNLGIFRIVTGDISGLNDLERAQERDNSRFVRSMYEAMLAIKSDSFASAEGYLKRRIWGLQESGIAKGLLAWTLEKLGKEQEAKKYWYRCYCQLPFGTDVESMRNFIDKFVETIKQERKSEKRKE